MAEWMVEQPHDMEGRKGGCKQGEERERTEQKDNAEVKSSQTNLAPVSTPMPMPMPMLMPMSVPYMYTSSSHISL
jgi:hypothetical protein